MPDGGGRDVIDAVSKLAEPPAQFGVFEIEGKFVVQQGLTGEGLDAEDGGSAGGEIDFAGGVELAGVGAAVGGHESEAEEMGLVSGGVEAILPGPEKHLGLNGGDGGVVLEMETRAPSQPGRAMMSWLRMATKTAWGCLRRA